MSIGLIWIWIKLIIYFVYLVVIAVISYILTIIGSLLSFLIYPKLIMNDLKNGYKYALAKLKEQNGI